MLSYYVRLALRSFVRYPGLTAIMVVAIGLGIAVCVMMLTIYQAMAGNPIWWKSERLYAVTMDSWAAERPANRDLPHLPPTQLTYRDGTYLFDAVSRLGSDAPSHKVIMYPVYAVVWGGTSQTKPLRVSTRITTADFFPMFETPFQYGDAWNKTADEGPEPVIVLSRDFNQKLFGGANSVGRTIRWNNREFRIIGVLDDWRPVPKFYDLTSGHFDEPEMAYIPWEWGSALKLRSGGRNACWKFEPIATYEEIVGSECVWLQMWLELPTESSRARVQSLVDAYWAEQRKTGRFQRPQNNRLTDVGQWLRDQQVVQDDNRLLVGLAFAFLGVCLLNTIGLLLAKFLNSAAISGVRRALGASRADIITQNLIEAGVLAFAGSLVGIVLSALGLWGIRALYTSDPTVGGGYRELAYFDTTSIVWAVILAIAAAIIAGLYPAWRVGRVQPSIYLKSQ